MCGICGVASFGPSGPADLSLVHAMLARLRHRGPDSSGYYRDRAATLASTRLAVIDVAGGTQPISNESASLWVTFNGEIYNYVELGRELRGLGHRFRTHSDTEVIVHAFEQWGFDCFRRFNGQWAIALWDRTAGRLVLCRDRLGVRPLYWALAGDRFIFASEIKALFADSAVRRALDVEGLAQVLSFWCPVAPATPFEGVRQLRPGHYAVFDAAGLRETPYWRIPFSPGLDCELPLEEAVLQVRDRVTEAVNLRLLRSDVPVAAYVSGGLDSTIVACLAAQRAGSALRTFGITFEDPEFDESVYQQEVVRATGCRHSSLRVSAEDIGRALPQAVWHAEHPLLRAAPVPLRLLSESVRAAGFKVVLTGEGADEMLAGYDIFREAVVRLFWSQDPQSHKRGAVAELLYPWMGRSPAKTPGVAYAFFAEDLRPDDPGFSHRPRWRATRMLQRLLNKDVRQQISAMDVSADLLRQVPEDFMRWPLLHRAQWLEMSTILGGYILSSQGDRMLMAHSVEGRFPFLDTGVVDLACSLPAWHKLFALSGKHVLKRAFADILPPGIVRRAKQPYRAPDAASVFPAAPLDWVEDVMSETSLRTVGIFDPSVVQSLARKCREARGRGLSNFDNMSAMLVSSTMLLHSLFVRDNNHDSASEGHAPLGCVVDLVGTEDPQASAGARTGAR